VVERTLDALPAEPVDLSGLEHVLAVDRAARVEAERLIARGVA
jgi:hypothetical protein